MLKRRLKLLGKILLALIVLLAAFLLFERIRGQIALANYKKELVAKGEKLSPKDFERTFTKEDNGAPAAIAAIQRLTNGIILPHSYPPRMRVMLSGRAIVGFRESEWVESSSYRDGEWIDEKVTNLWNTVIADVEANRETLEELRVALAKPVLNNGRDYSEGVKMRLLHLAPAKSAASWLGSASQAALHEGRNQDALGWLLAQIRLPRLLAEDQTIISELVRIAISAIARVDTWEALQVDTWTDDDLLKMQQAWEAQNFALGMARSFEGERIILDVWHDAMRASNEECFDGLFRWRDFFFFESFDFETGTWKTRSLTWNEQLDRFWKEYLYCPIWRFAWSHQSQLHGLASIHALIEIGRGTVTNKSNRDLEQSIENWTTRYFGGGFYSQIRRFNDQNESLPQSLSKALRAETDRSLVISAIALKRYSLRHGKHPATLDALVPKILSSVPTDYMDGKAIRYQLNEDGSFKLYSVGQDGRDDGGDLTPATTTKSLHLMYRRDYVWPAPATPEEIEVYRKEAADPK